MLKNHPRMPFKQFPTNVIRTIIKQFSLVLIELVITNKGTSINIFFLFHCNMIYKSNQLFRNIHNRRKKIKKLEPTERREAELNYVIL